MHGRYVLFAETTDALSATKCLLCQELKSFWQLSFALTGLWLFDLQEFGRFFGIADIVGLHHMSIGSLP